MKLLAILTLFISLLGGSMASASTTQLVEAGEELSLVTRTNGKNIFLHLFNKKGKVVQTLEVPATEKKTLRNYLPSIVSKKLKAEQGKFGTGAFVAKVMKQKMLRFPVESAGFFAALGAVMSYELIFNYAHNPIAYEQLYQSQLDPVGQLGFYFFMVGNGVSAEPLMHLVQNGKLNPKLAPFIPFFGMSVGFVASNIVHELGNAPNMWACARSLLGGQGMQTQACDQAATTWYERGGGAGIANEYAPSLLSLIGSTIVSGFVQSGTSTFSKMVVAHSIRKGLIDVSVKVVGQVSVRQLVRVGSIEVATLFAPGGMIVKFLRVGSFIGQLAVFSWLDEVMRRPIDFAYQNVTRGKRLQSMYNDISRFRTAMARSNYSAPDAEGIIELKNYGKAMTEWRQVNLSNVLESQANWEMALAQLSNSYKSTEIFYRDFIDHQRAKKFGRWAEFYASGQGVRVTDQVFPLYGITPSSLNAPMNELSLSAPNAIEKGQMITVQNVVNSLRSGQFMKTRNLSALNEEEKQKFAIFMKGFSSPNPMSVGKALQWAQIEISAHGNDRLMAECAVIKCVTGSSLQRTLMAILKALGNPNPIMIPGLGFAKYYQSSAEMAEQIQKTQYPKTYGNLTDNYRIQTNTLAESMIASMLIGPDVEHNQSVIADQKGFSAVFRAPKIAKDVNLDFILSSEVMEARGLGAGAQSVFTTDVGSKNGGGKLHDSAFAYLSKDGIRSSVLNEKDSSAFDKWWDGFVENQFVSAWMRFETQYQQNVAKLVLKLWNTEQSAWNTGGTPNGVLTAMDLENEQYLGILKSMALSIAPQKNTAFKMIKPVMAADSKNQPFWQRPLLVLKKPWDYSLPQKPSLLAVAKPNQQLSAAIAWHESIIRSLNAQKASLKKIRVARDIIVKKNPNEVFTISSLTNNEIESSVKNVNQTIDAAKAFFRDLQMSVPQKALAAICLEGLKKNSNEIKNYALIANAVSYRARKDKNGWISPRCEKMIKDQKRLGLAFVQKVADCE